MESAAPAEEFRFALRPMVDDDVVFIVDSWRRSYLEDFWCRCPGGLKEAIATQRQVVDQALATSEVVIAHPEAPDRVPGQILGWCCFRRPAVVQYVYVKPFYRRGGIGHAMLEHAVGGARTVFLTHNWRGPADRTQGIRAVIERAIARGVRLELNPALIFG